ncbi:MAG TPA: tetratricopeptide repeat protein [Chloroflexi bacterium]|nr:tetratricopeptide repeat protein [Chloroflexota bacterium]
MSGLYVRLFGSLEWSLGDAPLTVPPSQKARSLLSYLLVHHDRPIPRDRLLGLFWPERSESSARRALSHALWQIRRALGPAADRLVTDPGAVIFRFLPEDRLDVETFQQLCVAPSPLPPGEEIQRLREAVSLYRADFLEGTYDDWALLERERLRELYLRALERLIVLYKQAGNYPRALTCALRLVAADPLREEVHRELMRIYHLLGRDQAALKQFEMLRRILREELDIEPSPATTVLAREIALQADLTVAHLPAVAEGTLPLFLEEDAATPLVGRREERAALLAHLDAALAGHGRLVLLEGEAGVGKTRLLQEIARDASWRGVQVLWGQNAGPEPPAPYQPLAEALESALSPLRVEQLSALLEPACLQEIVRLIPSLAEWLPGLEPAPALQPQQEQERFLEALTRVLLGLAQIAPHLLIIEDLQWADEATFQVLAHLVRRLGDSRLLVLASYREEEARAQADLWERLQDLDRLGGGYRMRLARLDQKATAQLLSHVLGFAPVNPRFGQWVYRESEGNPLFALEILRSLHGEGVLYRNARGAWGTPWDDEGGPPENLLPPTVEQVTRRRLGRLTREARVLLNAAAVLGEEASFQNLCATTGFPQEKALSILDELRQQHLLLEGSIGYRFGHAKMRQAVYEAIPVHERRALHRRAFAALQGAPYRCTTALAHHAERGEMWSEAARGYRRLGRYAADLHAYTVARMYYERALTLIDRAGLPDAEQFDLRREHEVVLGILGEREEQMVALAEMARLAGEDPARRAYVHHRRALVLTQISRFLEAEEEARQALRLARALNDRETEAQALLALGRALGIRGEVDEAIPHLESAVRIAHAVGDRPLEVEARATAASAYLAARRYGPARDHAEAALRLAEELDRKHTLAGMWGTLGRIEAMTGNLARAEECYRRSLEICEAIGYRQGKARSLLNWGVILADQGRIGQALRRYQAALEAYRGLKDRRGEAITLGNLADLYHVYLGDDEAASRYAREALHLCEVTDNPDVGYHLLVLGRIAVRRGAYREAGDLLQRSLRAMRATRKRRGEVAAHRALAAWALALGYPQQALNHLRDAEAACREAGAETDCVGVLADRGEALLALGRPDEALEATTQAVARLQPGVEQRYRVLFVHHRALRAVGREREARDVLEQAHRALMETLEGLPEPQRRTSLERVPVHRAILTAWKAASPRRVVFRLPVASAPTGRPLRDDEWVEVTWTVDAPEDRAISGKVARRRHRLLRLLEEAREQGAAPTVAHLAEALGVSERTLKRDLAALRAAGHPIPTRGQRAR